jgi:hypothetical protein
MINYLKANIHIFFRGEFCLGIVLDNDRITSDDNLGIGKDSMSLRRGPMDAVEVDAIGLNL